MVSAASWVRLLKKGTLAAGMVLMFVSTINVSSNIARSDYQEKKIAEIEGYLPSIRETIKTDVSRRAAIAKIMGIIEKYNADLEHKFKQTIAIEIYEMSLKYQNLDIDLICATITHESAKTWRHDIVSPAGAMGLMQIMPYTGLDLSEPEGIKWTTPEQVLYNPIYNIRMGCRYLSSLIDEYHLDGGLAAYNGGVRQAQKWLASGRKDDVLVAETREYVPAVLKLYINFKN